jgi:alkaline phosphatase
MTTKAIDILQERSQKEKSGWFLMSEAASIDKVSMEQFYARLCTTDGPFPLWMMHVLDYDRALGELLELDDTVKNTIDRACARDRPGRNLNNTCYARLEKNRRIP